MKNTLVKLVGLSVNTSSFISKSFAAEKALDIFSTPLKGKPNEEQSDFLNTAFKEELQHNNTPIMTYRWLGKKETILLVHGWESNSARWKNLILELKAKDYNIVALDAPAHGNSGSKRFNALLYAEFIHVVAKKYNPSIIIGHSVGGMASVYFQHTHQISSVKKMILLGAPSEFSGILNRYVEMLGYNRRVTNQLNSIIRDRFGVTPKEFSTSKFISSIKPKTLIIHDELDKIIPYQDALLLKNAHSNSKLITTNGFGHSLNNATVSNYIHSFLEG
ncbi:alpha/beta fold hydrolase [Mangrovimonas sp. YM274]|uniref:alpha/beta fold hydrolase n=1 Tax=Mangrovimonas sp. YM274 TaxID=3070660 RepID=UPI0027DBE988|nr:alpha/beta hydrolase [Mangrovimonas sp. YM274]WMI67953.1 alpha/beta hydrolase [Mangrovimonas sp. YM274]